jgi:hypothetical protein
MKKPISFSIVLLAGTCVGIGPVWSAQTQTNPTEQIQKGPMDSNTGSGTSQPESGSSNRGTSGMEKNSGNTNTGESDLSHSPMRGQMGGQGNVQAVQEALKQKGFDPGSIDGVMGPKTMAALRSFQQSNSLQATGRLDSQTAQQLGVESSATGSKAGSMSGRSSSSGMGTDQNTGTSSKSSGKSGNMDKSTGSDTNSPR